MSPDASGYSEPDPPAWARKEFAWPLSLLIGFGATWVGLQIPIPGLVAVLAAGAIAPLYFQFQNRGDLVFATFIGIGWLIGSGAAGVGMAIEGDLERVLGALPQGRYAAQRWIEPWLDPRVASAASGATWISYAFVAGFAIVGLVCAALGRGLLMLLWVALGFGAQIGVAATYADTAAKLGEPPLSAWAWGWPPLAVLALGCLLWAGSALALPNRGVPVPGRRNALLLGIPLTLVALSLQLLLHERWARWAAERLLG